MITLFLSLGWPFSYSGIHWFRFYKRFYFVSSFLDSSSDLRTYPELTCPVTGWMTETGTNPAVIRTLADVYTWVSVVVICHNVMCNYVYCYGPVVVKRWKYSCPLIYVMTCNIFTLDIKLYCGLLIQLQLKDAGSSLRSFISHSIEIFTRAPFTNMV